VDQPQDYQPIPHGMNTEITTPNASEVVCANRSLDHHPYPLVAGVREEHRPSIDHGA
jgi:hypothetical protein